LNIQIPTIVLIRPTEAKMRCRGRALLVIFGMLVFGNFSFGQSQPAKPAATKPAVEKIPDTAWLNDVTRVPPGENQNLESVYCEYGLSWNNVLNAGKLNVGIAKSEAAEDSPASYLGGANGKSSGIARALWPYDFEAASVVRQSDLRPIAFNMKEKERNRTLDYHILFESKKLVCSTTKPKEDGTEDSVTHLLTYKHDFGQDLFSAILYLRSLPLKDGDEVDMVVTPFNRPYLAQFKVEGHEKKKIKGEKYDTIRLSAKIRKINKDLSIQNYDKMKKATIWLSEDEFRLPLEIHADLTVGFVSARLTKREWAGDIQIAGADPVEGEAGEQVKPTAPEESSPTNWIQEQKDSAPTATRKPSLFKRLFSR